MFTSVGFIPSASVLHAIDHAFPIEAKGWVVQHWDCDLIWDDEFKTSSARFRRHAEMNSRDSNEKVREGLEVEVVLRKLNATREELETATIRACNANSFVHILKGNYIGQDRDDYYPGLRYTLVCD